MLCVQLPAASESPLYVLAASARRPELRPLIPGGLSSYFLPPISHVYLRPATHSGAVQLQPSFGARVLKSLVSTAASASSAAAAGAHEIELWGSEAVELEKLHELVFEVRNDSYVIDECVLLDGGDGSGSTGDTAILTRLVWNGCAVSPEVRLLQPLLRSDPFCRNQSAAASTQLLRERVPSTDAAELCRTCHPYVRLAVARTFLERHVPPNLSASNRGRRLARIECTLVSFEEKTPWSSTQHSVGTPAQSVSEESLAFRRALKNLGFEPCPVRKAIAYSLQYRVVLSKRTSR